jgi:hypothetical protein
LQEIFETCQLKHFINSTDVDILLNVTCKTIQVKFGKQNN